MAHFAQLDENNKVIQVIVIADGDCQNKPYPLSEQFGQEYIASLGLEGTWKQTSYNNNFRNTYAGIGAVYIPSADIFTTPQPFPSWTLNEDHDWKAPVAKPNADGFWGWDETTKKWVR